MNVRQFTTLVSALKQAQKRQLLPYTHQKREFAISLGFLSGNKGGHGAEKVYMRDAETFFSNVLEEHDKGLMFAGTGQYMLKDNSRLIVINFDKNFLKDHVVYLNHKHLLDIGFNPKHRNKLNECINESSDLHVYSGVLDFVNNSHWKYGFTLNPYSMFSQDERLCYLKGGTLLTSVRGIQETFEVSDIDHVGVWVSRFPHTQRRLVLGLKGASEEEITSMALIDSNSSDTTGDLFRLAVETEWMLKAAALLCAKIKRQGNKEIYLKVSAPLQPKNNVWVAIQQKKWMKMVKKNAKNGDF